jgi:hypothetical protein
VDPALCSPLPEDWTVGVADIVESTRAIAAQRYNGGEPSLQALATQSTAGGLTEFDAHRAPVPPGAVPSATD